MKLNFIFGLHNHQPVGNFDNVFESAFKNAYFPFLNVLKNYPQIKLSMHYTGILFNWFEKHQTAFIDLIGKMINSGQIELLSGGYYEPILPIIPDEDKLSQIIKMNKYIKNRFGVKPKGMWLAERVWEPHLVKYIADTGIKYIVMDDSHFKFTGISNNKLQNGYFITEEEGKTLYVFPNNKSLRYLMPFQSFERSIEYMAEHVDDTGKKLLVMADDGEKFGDWPFTFKSVYEEKWLENFLNRVIENEHWINSLTFSEYLDKHEPVGKIYLPTASYSEMMEWAMPTDKILLFEKLKDSIEKRKESTEYESFFKGGFWRNFLTKYDEANFMHKKMLYVSKKVNSLRKNTKKSILALELLHQGQCNCSYWHGTFGGLYLPHLRTAVYESLIKAEKICDNVSHKTKKWIEYNIQDIDCDGKLEIIINTDKLSIYIKPSSGGSIFELDHKNSNYNIVNTLSRRKESYHEKLLNISDKNNDNNSIPTINDIMTKQKDLDKHLIYDKFLRHLYQEHILLKDVNIEDIYNNSFYDIGDFISGSYEYNIYSDENEIILYMWKFGKVWKNNSSVPVKIEKNYYFKAGKEEIETEYRILNISNTSIDIKFAVLCNLSLTSGNDPDRYYLINDKNINEPMLSSKGIEYNVKKISCIDMWKKINITFEFLDETTLFRFPIETVSNSEGGIEKIFQNFCLMPNWDIYLKPEQIWEQKIYQRITETK